MPHPAPFGANVEKIPGRADKKYRRFARNLLSHSVPVYAQ